MGEEKIELEAGTKSAMDARQNGGGGRMERWQCGQPNTVKAGLELHQGADQNNHTIRNKTVIGCSENDEYCIGKIGGGGGGG